MTATPLTIDLWSDIVCPWCWIGKHRLEQALEKLGVNAEWKFHAYELGPRQQPRQPTLQHLAEKYQVSLEEARQMVRRVQDLGRELGIDINPDKQFTAPTFDGHRLIQSAQKAGLGPALMERLHKAHFSEGRDVGDKDELQALAVAAGLDGAEAKRVLESDAYAKEVEEDEARAVSYDIGGVPFTVLNMRWAVSGAQPVEGFVDLLNEALGA
jgi:predicted DsbA family dithiol-disulfide isomerase